MPFSKSSNDSSSGSSSLSSRLTICSSSAKAFSNSFDLVRGILIGPERFDAHRFRVDRAFQPSFLELHFNRIADDNGCRVEDRLAAGWAGRGTRARLSPKDPTPA